MNLQDLYKQEKEKRREESIYIKLDDGESFVGKFVAVKPADPKSKYDAPNYIFLVKGKEKILSTKSFSFLEDMIKAKIKEGDRVTIKRDGVGTDTTYLAVKLEDEDEPRDIQDEDIPIIDEEGIEME